MNERRTIVGTLRNGRSWLKAAGDRMAGERRDRSKVARPLGVGLSTLHRTRNGSCDWMLHLLVDTCVWLDLAKDYRAQPILNALGDLVDGRQVSLIAPRIVVDEFLRNKGRVIEEARRS